MGFRRAVAVAAQRLESRRLSSLRKRGSATLLPSYFAEALESRMLLAAGTISISDASVLEGQSGTMNMNFTVTRTGDLTTSITLVPAAVALRTSW